MNRDESLTRKLEIERQRLYELSSRYGLNHAYVLQQSMLLDELINQHNRIHQAKRRPVEPIRHRPGRSGAGIP